MSRPNKIGSAFCPQSPILDESPRTARTRSAPAKSVGLALSLLLGASACNSSPATQAPDMGVPPAPDMASGAILAVTCSDFNTGSLSTVGLGSRAVKKDIDSIDPLTVARGFGNMLYVIDQSAGVVRAYDARQDFKNPIEFPASKAVTIKGFEADPHDIYIDAPRQLAYVSLYGTPGTLPVNASRALGVIDLKNPDQGITNFVPLTAAAADADGNPEADRMEACGDKLYVVLLDQDRNNSYAPTGPGRLAVVNLTNPGTPSYIQLAGRNPSGLTILPGCTEAIVGSAADLFGGVQAGLGGIERVDLVGLKSMGLVVKDTDLGGNVGTLDAVDAGHVFVAVSVKTGTTYNNTIYSVDLATKQKSAALLGPMSFVPSIRLLGGSLVVLSAGTAGAGQLPVGLYVGPATGAALSAVPLDVGLPPQSVALVTP